MAIDASTQPDQAWPLPRFSFEVTLNSDVMSFQEVSGLDTETQVIEYRSGAGTSFSTVKLPGLTKVGNVTLKKGVFKQDAEFWTWFNQIKMNTIQRTTVTIRLLDENGKPTMVWTLANAWPTKITGTDLKADGNVVAVKTIELAHEGLTVSAP